MSEKNEPAVGNYQRGLEVMAPLWGQDVANDMRMFWRSVDPDVERYIMAFALGTCGPGRRSIPRRAV